MGEKIGHRVYLVVEKLSELPLILEEASLLGVTPRIGLRARLSTVGRGRWQNTGGEKSKFGLTASQILAVVEQLRDADALESLQMVHFHLGSQIANIRDIQRGLRECARFYQSLVALGAPVDTVDVGGGLGIDYEGTRSRSFCSANYSMLEYARNVVAAFAQACVEQELPQPHIISESGRALTAHHAVLISNVIGEERVSHLSPERRVKDEPQVDELWRARASTSPPARGCAACSTPATAPIARSPTSWPRSSPTSCSSTSRCSSRCRTSGASSRSSRCCRWRGSTGAPSGAA